jgi:hypothetical protein
MRIRELLPVGAHAAIERAISKPLSYSENGWEQVGLPMEKQTDGGSYAEICDAAGITP